ncbi:MAG: efflux RND transporter periplasmic adaptor subunit [Alphaproteobacteria bacterium]|nr:efflux RND transporter periplasmic adaptor subunit [Alphaproteobacteria bacterium]
MTKKTKTALFLFLFGIMAAAALYFFYFPQNNSASTASGGKIVATVTVGNIKTEVTSQGTLEPRNYVDVGAQVSGQITKLHFDIGDDVTEGDLIAEIDPEIYESQIASDNAQLSMLEAQKKEKQATLKQAQRDYNRYANLVKNQAISRETFEQSETDLNVAKAQIDYLDAQIQQAQSELDKDKTNLNYTKIYAPMTGTIVSLDVQEGETVNANQTTPTIGRVADLDTMTAQAQVAEADVSRLKDGMDVYFTTLGSNSRKWVGHVRQILPTPVTENNVVLYSVLVDVDNKDRALMTGMTTQMYFVLGNAENALLIPVSALVKRVVQSDTKEGQAYLIKIPMAQPDSSQDKTVIVGLTDRTSAQIISGLSEGDSVLVPQISTDAAQQSPKMRMPGL